MLDFYFNVNGRISRGRWWLGWLGLSLAEFLLKAIMMRTEYSWALTAILVIGTVLTVCLFIITIKRAHDMGYSGWASLLLLPSLIMRSAPAFAGGLDFFELLAPEFIGTWTMASWALVVLYVGVFGTTPGEETTNRFGDPPSGKKISLTI